MNNIFHKFKTLEDIETISNSITNDFPELNQAILGINELMNNAVEHGNLGITSEEKQKLMMNGKLKQEIEKRLNEPSYKDKTASILIEKPTNRMIKITIKDEGSGFNHQQYKDVNLDNITDPNGRGIALARILSFDKLEYIGNGNEVVCSVAINNLPLNNDVTRAG